MKDKYKSVTYWRNSFGVNPQLKEIDGGATNWWAASRFRWGDQAKLFEKTACNHKIVCYTDHTPTKTRANKMQHLIFEIKGYMSLMPSEAAAKKVSRDHLGKKDFLISETLKEIQK